MILTVYLKKIGTRPHVQQRLRRIDATQDTDYNTQVTAVCDRLLK